MNWHRGVDPTLLNDPMGACLSTTKGGWLDGARPDDGASVPCTGPTEEGGSVSPLLAVGFSPYGDSQATLHGEVTSRTRDGGPYSLSKKSHPGPVPNPGGSVGSSLEWHVCLSCSAEASSSVNGSLRSIWAAAQERKTWSSSFYHIMHSCVCGRMVDYEEFVSYRDWQP